MGPSLTKIIGLVLVVGFVSAIEGCSEERQRDSSATPSKKEDKMSDQASQLLSVAEDTGLTLKARADAAAKLGKLKERATVDRLTRLLPGGLNVLTLEIVTALGEIGDPKALTTLRKMRQLEMQGKLRAELNWAIEQCEKNDVN